MTQPDDGGAATPRTDAECGDARNVALEFECKNPPPKDGENIYVVPADFARQLERELIAATTFNEPAERERFKKKFESKLNLDRWSTGEYKYWETYLAWEAWCAAKKGSYV